jgi:glycosyltransferase involved in cell wall biosynthesis
MVVFNGERFLREAVESVLTQTLRDFEFVVVDDGSTDSSLSILKEYSRSESRMRVIEARHGGEAAARNLGMAHATHDLIAVMDADDRMLPDRLERQLWFLNRNPDASVTCSFAYLINPEGKRIGRSSHTVDVEAGIRCLNPSLFVEIVHPSVAAVKASIMAVGGYRGVTLPDRDLWGRLVTAGYTIRCQHERLLEYRLHGHALSAKVGRKASEPIDENIVRRLRGAPEIPYECFPEWDRGRPLMLRLASARRHFATRQFKSATRHYAERHWPQCASSLLAASLARPVWTVSRALSAITISSEGGM